MVSDPGPNRRRRQLRDSQLPSERDWERSALLEPLPAPRLPELVGDGAGLPFPPSALDGPPEPLDPRDHAVEALLAYLTERAAPMPTSRRPWRRGTSAATPAPTSAPRLTGWRVLAREDDEVLFGIGRPPQLSTLAFRQAGRRRVWTCVGASSAPPLRAVRERIRASSWRLDPSRESWAQETTLRVLVAEQTFAAGKRADGRVLAPDIYIDAAELVLRTFVTPRPGFQARSPNPETPVRIALPHPVGARELIDGAVAQLQ